MDSWFPDNGHTSGKEGGVQADNIRNIEDNRSDNSKNILVTKYSFSVQ
jgi:hypothetical protein